MFKLIHIEANNVIPECEPDRMIENILLTYSHLPLNPPKLAKEITCSICQGNKGFYIPYKKTWSCMNFCRHEKKVKFEEPKEALPPIQENFKLSAIDDCHQDSAVLDFFRVYAKNPKGFLVLSGENGTGKTFSSIAILKDAKIGDYGFFISQSDLNQRWLNEMEKWKSSSYFLEKMVEYKLLILDDIGTRTPTEAFMDFLYNLIDKRYNSNSATIITTNLNANDLRLKFGDAFVSRVASGKCFRFKGKDRRKNEF